VEGKICFTLKRQKNKEVQMKEVFPETVIEPTQEQIQDPKVVTGSKLNKKSRLFLFSEG
jgi:hypothetical protein